MRKQINLKRINNCEISEFQASVRKYMHRSFMGQSMLLAYLVLFVLYGIFREFIFVVVGVGSLLVSVGYLIGTYLQSYKIWKSK